MADDFPRIISVDDHVIEPPHVWQTYLPGRFRAEGPRVIRSGVSRMGNVGGTYSWDEDPSATPCDFWLFEDLRYPMTRVMAAAGFPRDDVTVSPVTFEQMRPGCYEPTARLADMDAAGIEASLNFPTFPRFAGQAFSEARDKELGFACIQAYNDWMVEEWCADPRLVPLTLIPFWDPDRAAAEVVRNAARGVRAITFSEIPAYLGWPSIHDPGRYWDPLFAACADHDVVVCMHIGSGSRMPSTSTDAPPAVQSTATFTNCMLSMCDWLFSGLLERYPTLRIAYSEGQIGWIPYILERADHVWESNRAWGGVADLVPDPPSTYFARQVYGCFFSDRFGLENLVDIGEDNVMFECDYPHADSTWPDTLDVAKELCFGLEPTVVDKIMRGNAIELSGSATGSISTTLSGCEAAMGEHHQLLIRNGVLIDGSGNPRRRADVAARDGRIVAVGRLEDDSADVEIDAMGRIVAPGIIDPHTHYDPQITWDPYATASCFHGVTTVVAGNCGFSVAPTLPVDRPFFAGLFAKVEGMAPAALDGINWGFESFPEFLADRAGKLGVNMACYVGHCNLRRWVMGSDGSARAASPTEVLEMGRILAEAMAAGAVGLSSTHASTHNDGDNHPVPSRFAEPDELIALADELGRINRGSLAYLPRSAVGGLDGADMDLLIELGRVSGLPVIIQGLGGRNKVDAPGAGWDVALDFLERSRAAGSAVYSLLLARPFDRPFSLDVGTTLYEGVPAWDKVVAPGVHNRRALLDDPQVRAAMRDAVEHPTRDPDRGSTLPPPHWDVLFVGSVTDPDLDRFVGRSIADIAAEQRVPPADAMLDLALADDLATHFRWVTETEEWMDAVRAAQHNPHMITGTSDGGAHLSRDDGSDYSTYFLRRWVLDLGEWTLEQGIRQLTSVPAALLGFRDRGLVQNGHFCDLMILDPTEIRRPGRKELVHDLPAGTGRFQAYPNGIHATIVNGVPIVLDGKLTGELPGQVVSPV